MVVISVRIRESGVFAIELLECSDFRFRRRHVFCLRAPFDEGNDRNEDHPGINAKFWQWLLCKSLHINALILRRCLGFRATVE
jgi:hypothetical protein